MGALGRPGAARSGQERSSAARRPSHRGSQGRPAEARGDQGRPRPARGGKGRPAAARGGQGRPGTRAARGRQGGQAAQGRPGGAKGRPRGPKGQPKGANGWQRVSKYDNLDPTWTPNGGGGRAVATDCFQEMSGKLKNATTEAEHAENVKQSLKTRLLDLRRLQKGSKL